MLRLIHPRLVADVYFTADCTMTSTVYNGSVSLSLSLASLADDGSGSGTVTLQGTYDGVDFFASITGSVAIFYSSCIIR